MNASWQRASGISGILGGLILFAGDMLFLSDTHQTDFLNSMANNSDLRITLSGVSALFAAWFYVLGLGQIYYAFTPAKVVLRNIVLVSLGGILIAYGIAHGTYVAIATTAKVAAENNLDLVESSTLARQIYDIIVLCVYPIFAVCSFIFITQVWKKNTLYPRWIILFYPLLPFLLQSVFDKILVGKTWGIVLGGYLNLLFIVFFTASTIALWKVKKNEVLL